MEEKEKRKLLRNIPTRTLVASIRKDLKNGPRPAAASGRRKKR